MTTNRQALVALWQAVGEVAKTALASVTAKPITSDSKGWTVVTRAGSGPADRPWYDVQEDLVDALDAWRKNFLIRQIVRLTTAYVVGDGIKVESKHPWVKQFCIEFWHENKILQRLPSWCDELTRSGELFIPLFSNRVTGMQYVRAIPSSQIESVLTDPEDYEKETGYVEIIPNSIERKSWPSALGASTTEPIVLHFTINKPVGATRGEGDLVPILPWAKRYTEWLKDRVAFNRMRNELAGVDVEIADDSQVEKRQKYYNDNPPTNRSITVHGQGEKISYRSVAIAGWDAEPDGRALRLAFAAGANLPLHFLSEGSSATRSAASEMGDPTHRHFRMRQQVFACILVDLIEQAYMRRCAVLGRPTPKDLMLYAEVPDVSRADNQSLAESAKTIVEAFALMKTNGWVDSETAIRLAFKFAGEILPDNKIEEILANEQPQISAPDAISTPDPDLSEPAGAEPDPTA